MGKKGREHKRRVILGEEEPYRNDFKPEIKPDVAKELEKAFGVIGVRRIGEEAL